jgi:uncharacterized membrane protein
LQEFPYLDVIAVAWLMLWWVGYTYVTDGERGHVRDLAKVMHGHRRRWMERMLERENRMTDVNIVIAHHRSGGLFCSTSLLIVAGVVAILGNVERLRGVLSDISFAAQASSAMIEAKAILLLLIFVYAFFKFAWCLRQYNNALILIGGAPVSGSDVVEEHTDYAERAARVLTRANVTFNRGLRAYYFGLATLAWFIQPLLFIAAVVWVILVLYRRDYRSITLTALDLDGPDTS